LILRHFKIDLPLCGWEIFFCSLFVVASSTSKVQCSKVGIGGEFKQMNGWIVEVELVYLLP
jgi:hypothetical protein